ncbi:glycosyltransferase [Caproicibacter fermentans]|uniref:Glycosyltransferase n=1 Tax=Caproicibacter fermentans TaxID=2576756 RepID=A0A7G8TES3_9FIRM|nr:glycosyltransferase [Caproicibacter fermentans]QNK42114.1 glycosyltransferase [Caproicibacter fermentans]
MRTIQIVFPVLNEERRLKKGIMKTVEYMEQNFAGRYRLMIVDNGSEDGTAEIAGELTQIYDRVSYLRLAEKGVGLALRAGVRENTCDIVGYMDIDLSTSLDHLKEVDRAFHDPAVQIVNGSRLSRDSVVTGRKPLRNLTSHGFRLMMKLLFGMKIDDALCGFKFFRRETIESLMPHCSDTPGWFYCAELLLRAERAGIVIREIPVTWQDDYDTTVHVGRLVRTYLAQMARLYAEFHFYRR